MNRRLVGILIFADVEVLDFAGPFEVFSVTRLNEERRREEPSPFEVKLIAERLEPIVASSGLRVLPDFDLGNCPTLDILVVPGGWGTRKEIENKHLIDWIQRLGNQVETLSRCALVLCFSGVPAYSTVCVRPLTGELSIGCMTLFQK